MEFCRGPGLIFLRVSKALRQGVVLAIRPQLVDDGRGRLVVTTMITDPFNGNMMRQTCACEIFDDRPNDLPARILEFGPATLSPSEVLCWLVCANPMNALIPQLVNCMWILH